MKQFHAVRHLGEIIGGELKGRRFVKSFVRIVLVLGGVFMASW